MVLVGIVIAMIAGKGLSVWITAKNRSPYLLAIIFLAVYGIGVAMVVAK